MLRSHLRMSGRWALQPRGTAVRGRPWLILRGPELEAVLWGGPVLELHTRALAGLGPDILGSPPDLDAMLVRLRGADGTRSLGETLMDQSLVAGIGNIWMAETLWHEQLSPWLRLADVPEDDRRRVLETRRRTDARRRRRGPRAAQAGLRPGRPAVPALPDADPLPRPGRREPHRVLVPDLPARVGDSAAAA